MCPFLWGTVIHVTAIKVDINNCMMLTSLPQLVRADFIDNCIELWYDILEVWLLSTARFWDDNLLFHELIPQPSFLHSITNQIIQTQCNLPRFLAQMDMPIYGSCTISVIPSYTVASHVLCMRYGNPTEGCFCNWNFCSNLERHYIPASDCSTFQASCKMVESRGHHRELSAWGECSEIRKRRDSSQKDARSHQPCTLWELTLLFHPGIHTSAWTTHISQMPKQIHIGICRSHLRLLVVGK